MNVDATILGQLQNFFAENLPKGGHNDELRIPTLKLLHGFGFT